MEVPVPTAGSHSVLQAIAGVAVDAVQPAEPRHLPGGVPEVVDGQFVPDGLVPVDEAPNAPAVLNLYIFFQS